MKVLCIYDVTIQSYKICKSEMWSYVYTLSTLRSVHVQHCTNIVPLTRGLLRNTGVTFVC